MNRQNILSAGWMMAIVVALLGVVFCFIPLESHNIPFGIALIICGLSMVVMFALAGKKPTLALPALIVASLTAVLGIIAVIVYRNPFSWMAAIVGMAIFIDALCLKISLLSHR